MKNKYKPLVISGMGWVIGVSLLKLAFYITEGSFDSRNWLFSIVGGIIAIGIVCVCFLLYDLLQKKNN
ncbi:MAG TPA: hypothetical protein VK108_05485 [Pseudogracilibacillus sp.]|nr:hypothetical protein [Pseudogracilibacillus sp.]